MRGQPDPFKEPLHVGQRADGDAHASHFTGRQRVIGIHAHLGRQIERDGKPGDALRQQITIAAIAFFGGSEARRTGAWSRAGCGTYPDRSLA